MQLIGREVESDACRLAYAAPLSGGSKTSVATASGARMGQAMWSQVALKGEKMPTV